MLKDYTLKELIEMLEMDFAMLHDESWIPDHDSIEASTDVLAEIKRRVTPSSTIVETDGRWSFSYPTIES